MGGRVIVFYSLELISTVFRRSKKRQICRLRSSVGSQRAREECEKKAVEGQGRCLGKRIAAGGKSDRRI